MKIYNINNDNTKVTLRLGQNAKENHSLIDDADPNDWWFHLDDLPSGHCIVEKLELNKNIINQAAVLVKENTKYKTLQKVKVTYLQIKHIKKTKNPGEVTLLKKGNVIII
uniref:NFACT RNA-binding domain-containing protein n=1 Tax=viral metagenome TaxID=1070528 RepID=A0A6C0J6J5_9ZZZZ